MAGKSNTSARSSRASSAAADRVERVSARRQQVTAAKKRAPKRTIKRKTSSDGPSERIRAVKPTAEHPLPVPTVSVTW